MQAFFKTNGFFALSFFRATQKRTPTGCVLVNSANTYAVK
jgi:hypothetical protein